MPFFKPDRFLTRVTALDPVSDIKEAGFAHVFLDLDNTLLTRDTHEVPADIKGWLDRLKEAGVAPCILTNNWHHGAHEWAERLGLPIVSHAVKPLPFAYFAAMKKGGGAPPLNAVHRRPADHRRMGRARHGYARRHGEAVGRGRPQTHSYAAPCGETVHERRSSRTLGATSRARNRRRFPHATIGAKNTSTLGA